MAQLAHTAIAEIRQAMREGRSTIVVGPARSGLSWIVNHSAAVGVEPVIHFSMRGIKEVPQLQAAAARLLGLGRIPERPGDLQLSLADMAPTPRPGVVAVNDCHRGSPECLAWLLEAALEPVAGLRQAAVPFVFEGAIDPDIGLGHAFPSGSVSQPLVQYVEPSTPWRVFTEIDEMMKGRWRHSFAPGLIPWMADTSGGDVGVAQEILERLPNDGEIRDETLRAAARYVASNGFRAREIRESIAEVNDEVLLRIAATGRGIVGLVPSALESCSLKRAYFAGIVAYDGLARVYRIRGPIVARIVAGALGMDADKTVFEGQFILSRLLVFFAYIAALEVDLRSLLRDRDPRTLAAEVSAETGLGDYHKKVRDAVYGVVKPAADAMGSLRSCPSITCALLDRGSAA